MHVLDCVFDMSEFFIQKSYDKEISSLHPYNDIWASQKWMDKYCWTYKTLFYIFLFVQGIIQIELQVVNVNRGCL